MLEQERTEMISIPERQPTVAYTKDLSLPIDFLPGEDDVKLKESKYSNVLIVNLSIIVLRSNLSRL